MSLTDRIARLESLLNSAAVALPVLLDDQALRDYAEVSGTRTIFRSADGMQWQQADDESTETFVERAKREARRGFRPASPVTAIRLVALRPRLTMEQWQERHNLSAAAPDWRPTT